MGETSIVVRRTPAGPVSVRWNTNRGIVGLDLGTELEETTHEIPEFEGFLGLLDRYFSGFPVTFPSFVAPDGTPFQRQVWQACRQIPYGKTFTYGQLANTMGRPNAARAVGTALGRNPVPIVVPCHRVVGANGCLTGFSAGLEWKRYLLELEGVCGVG